MRSRPPFLIPLLVLAGVCVFCVLIVFLRARGTFGGLADGSNRAAPAVDARDPASLESQPDALPLPESAAPAPRAAAEGLPSADGTAELPQAEARIDGIVLRPDGRPAALSRVQFTQWRSDRGPEEQPEDSTVSDEQGAFTIHPAPVGSLQLVAMHDEFASSAPLQLSLAAGEHKRDLRLELREYGRIRGVVLDAHGVALAKVSVVCEDLDSRKALFAESDAAGRFEFAKVVAGTQLVSLKHSKEELEEIRVDAPFLANMLVSGDQERFVELAPGQTLELVLGGIPPEGVRVFGRVTSGENGLPRTWLWAEGDSHDWRGTPRTRSDERGAYELWLPRQGTYLFHLIGAGGGLDLVREVSIQEKTAQHVDFDLPGASLAGRVVDGAGRPVTQVEVTLLSSSQGSTIPAGSFALWSPHEPVDADGRFEFAHLPAGRYELRATPISRPDAESAFGRASVTGIELAAGTALAGLEIVLTPGCTIRGVVHGAPERIQRMLWVTAYDSTGHHAAGARVDADGSFVLRGLPEGSYGLCATGPDLASPVGAPIAVRGGREEQVELRIGPSAGLVLGVKPAPGPQPSAVELAVRDGRRNALFESDLELLPGNAARIVLAPGTYEVEVTGTGGWRGVETVVLEAGKDSRVEVLLRRAQ